MSSSERRTASGGISATRKRSSGVVGPCKRAGKMQGESKVRQRRGVVGLLPQKLVKQANGFLEILRVEPLDVPMGAHQAFPRAEFVEIFRLRSLHFCRHDFRVQWHW